VNHLTPSPARPLVPQHTIEWFYRVGEIAVTSRKPTFVRWAEEAEAKQVCEWAGLEQVCDRSDVDTEQSHGSRERLPFLRRLRGLFGSQTAQIERDG
jgi:hypothetical protein